MIPGFFSPENAEPEPSIEVGVSIPALRVADESVVFLIDTAATESTLHPFDAERRFALDLDQLFDSQSDRLEWRTGVGGAAQALVASAVYTFKNEDGTTTVVDGDIRIARPTSTNLYLPSLLGWDMLRYFAIHLDWGERLVTLDLLPAARSRA